MKKHISSFLSGALAMGLAVSLGLSAMAATGTLTGKVTFGGVSIKLNENVIVDADATMTTANGQEIPGSITYTDESGGGSIYLPLRKITEVIEGIPVTYSQEDKTVYLGVLVDAYMEQLMKENLVNGDYPKNSKGESYGPLPLSGIVGHEPDLIAVVATNDLHGYVRLEDFNKASNGDPSEPKPLSVYDLEGNVVGEYVVETGSEVKQ